MFFNGNWVDFIIIIILAYFVSEAFRVGFWILLADFLGFLMSLFIALWGYEYIADLLRSNFSLPISVSKAVGFLLTASVSEFILGYFLMGFVKKIPYKYWKKPMSKLLGIIPAVGEGLVICAFILTLALGLPLTPKIKRDVSNSKIGGYLTQRTTGFEKSLNQVFGGLVEDSLTFLTVKPQANEVIPLDVGMQELLVDKDLEQKMLVLVNNEREKVGAGKLVWREDAAEVARNHAIDMWERKYFGHISLDGLDVGDRLDQAGVDYMIAGENLALAPTLQTAHQGLMDSEGHRENILDPDFERVGIGVVENGIYGVMFVQVFTN